MSSNGISVDLVSGLDLLVHVLWLQSCNQDSDALSVLQFAQDEYLQTVSISSCMFQMIQSNILLDSTKKQSDSGRC